jgi:hypothetical protein
MVDFAQQEKLVIPELTSPVLANIGNLYQLTTRFEVAQRVLETDEIGSGSYFIGHLLTIRYLVHKYADTQALAVQEFDRYFEKFKGKYSDEYRILLLMTYLNPSTQFQVGRTCSEPEFDGMRNTLAELVEEQIAIETTGTQEIDDHGEPGSDDFSSYILSSQQRTIVRPQDQIGLYQQIRDSCQHSKDFWDRPPPELNQLSVVANRILRLLTTSASVERAFSCARAVCTDYQLAQKQETVSSRVLICANWGIAEPLLREVLAVPVRYVNDLERESVPWRMGVHTEAE